MFNTRGEYWLNCKYLIPSVFISNSPNIQLAAEAAIISFISVIVIFIWIGVRSISFHVSLLFDEMLHSGTCGGIRRRFQTVIGSCSMDLLTSTWSAWQLLCCHLLGSLNFTIVLAFRVRLFASNWRYPQYQVGSQRDRHGWALLHRTRHYFTDW
jgi:hypothetical protein